MNRKVRRKTARSARSKPRAHHQPTVAKLAYTVDQYVEASGFSRSRIFDLIASGKLRTFKIGKRRMIGADAGRECIAQCERQSAEAGA